MVGPRRHTYLDAASVRCTLEFMFDPYVAAGVCPLSKAGRRQRRTRRGLVDVECGDEGVETASRRYKPR